MILVVAPAPPTWLPLAGATNVELVTAPAVLRLAARVWGRRRADRRITADFLLRAVADRRAARRMTSDTTAVYAASLAAQRSFAAVRGASTRLVLVEDLPDLQHLHADLDRAALAHPEARFLRRHRAARRFVVRQQSERVLADELVVRSHLALERLLAAGVAGRVRLRAAPVGSGTSKVVPRRPTVLLAGPATARGGLFEALAVADAVPEVTLVVRVSEGMEPPDALERPNVRAASEADARLEGIDLVLAPAWCESDLPEVAAARTMGLPVVATDRAAGTADVLPVEVGDVEALVDAVRALRDGTPRTGTAGSLPA